MKRLLAVSFLVVLVACGGDSPSTPTPAPTPVPTPVPVSYAGTFSSNTMTYTDEFGIALATASVRVAEAGNTLVFGTFDLTSPFPANYPLGSASHTSGRFDGTGGYDSRGCGRATSRFTGYYSADGRIMNLTITLTFTSGSSGCGTTDIRGELRR